MNFVRTSTCAAVVAAAFLAAPVMAASFSHSTLTPGQRNDAGRYSIDAVTVTQNATSNIVSGNSVSCNNGFASTDNSYMRRFVLDTDNGIVNPFQVTRVDFGIEQATSNTGGTQPLTINLYQIAKASPLLFGNLTLIGTTTITVPDQGLDIVQVPVSTTLSSPTTTDLVVEVFSPAGNLFFIGSNSDGQSHPCYLAAADCGVTQPTSTAALGFPGMIIYMALVGAEIPTATASRSWGSIKTLYR